MVRAEAEKGRMEEKWEDSVEEEEGRKEGSIGEDEGNVEGRGVLQRRKGGREEERKGKGGDGMEK